MSHIKITVKYLTVAMAVIGLVFTFVFVGMYFGVFNVKGSIDNRNKFYTGEDTLPLIEKIQEGFRKDMASVRKSVFPEISFAWINTDEWNTVSIGLTKDRDVIRRAASEANISPRILVAVVIAEQIRFFTSNRENFKKVFEPLKILGSLSQFSLGVSGIKPDTAKKIEDNLKNPNSPFYISKDYEHVLDYGNAVGKDISANTKIIANEGTGTNSNGNVNANIIADTSTSTDTGLYSRLTDEHDHYYSYLYTALFIKEVEAQWMRAGFDISNRPEILATIFNLGFDKSVPKKDPEVAGSVIDIGGEKISFGRLAYEFYYSGELLDIFGF